jgi:gluconate 5-dehydrogenase
MQESSIALFIEFSAERFEAIMRSNVYGPFFVAQAVARGMTARARGSIINICSVQSELGRPSIVPYTASKGAMKMMTKAMAAELGSSSLRVNELAPGYFRTDLNEALAKNPAFSDWLVNRTPLGRWGGKRMNSSALQSFWRRTRRASSQARSSTWTAG